MYSGQKAALISALMVILSNKLYAECPKIQGRWEGSCDDLRAIQIDLTLTDCYLLSVNEERFLIDGANSTHQSVGGGTWTIIRSATAHPDFKEIALDRSETSISFLKEGARMETRSILKKLSFSENKLKLREVSYSRDAKGSQETVANCELTKI